MDKVYIEQKMISQFAFGADAFQVLEQSLGKRAEQFFGRKPGLVDGCSEVPCWLRSRLLRVFYPHVGVKDECIEAYQTGTVQLDGLRCHIDVEAKLAVVKVDLIGGQTLVIDVQAAHFGFSYKASKAVVAFLLRQTARKAVKLYLGSKTSADVGDGELGSSERGMQAAVRRIQFATDVPLLPETVFLNEHLRLEASVGNVQLRDVESNKVAVVSFVDMKVVQFAVARKQTEKQVEQGIDAAGVVSLCFRYFGLGVFRGGKEQKIVVGFAILLDEAE